jgi:hypothetical protein
MVLSGLDVTPVLTHRFKVDQFREAFEVMRSGNSGKVLLEWRLVAHASGLRWKPLRHGWHDGVCCGLAARAVSRG